jgi:hypothetical protein
MNWKMYRKETILASVIAVREAKEIRVRVSSLRVEIPDCK